MSGSWVVTPTGSWDITSEGSRVATSDGKVATLQDKNTTLQAKDTTSEGQKVATLQAKDTTSEGQKDATLQAKDITLHVSGVQSTRMTREKLQELILDYCTEWRSAEEIAIHVHRSKQYIRGEILPGMDHLLIRKYPLKEKHPGQKYKVKE